jgi:hypothetical protein
MGDIRPIAVLQQSAKVLEKAIKNKMVSVKSKLLTTGNY